MPGSYAHLTMVGEARRKDRLRKIEGFPLEGIKASGKFLKFLELGAVSPDYPYLDIGSKDSKRWADAMHYTHTGALLYAAADGIKDLPDGDDKLKCLAWLMGFAAHIVGDMYIHPVIELKVGTYDQNPREHRRCEMHQDAYIFPRLGLDMPHMSGHLQATILKCGSKEDPERLDPVVRDSWSNALGIVHPDLFKEHPPDFDIWHQRCRLVLGTLLSTSSRLVPCARHVCDGLGLVYPETDQVERQYIEDLVVPSTGDSEVRMNYSDLFHQSVIAIRTTWREVLRHALGIQDATALRGKEWNLDTGRDQTFENRLAFWGVA